MPKVQARGGVGVTATKVKGLPEVQKTLDGFADNVKRRIAGRGVRSAATIVRNYARMQAPKKSGALKRNIKYKRARKSRVYVTYFVGVETGKVGAIDAAGTVFNARTGKRRKATGREKRGEDPFYYRWVEQGFHARGTRRGGPAKRFVLGQKFLSKSIARTAPAALSAMRRQINTEIHAEYHKPK